MGRLLVLLMIAMTIGGCSTYAIDRYAISADSVIVLRSYKDQKINVGEFTSTIPGLNHIDCRAVGPIKTPDGEPFSDFIRDALIDELQIAELKLSFDPINVPRDQFLVAGQAWQLCRHKHVNPETFGIFDMRGLWFVRDNLVRDVAALNKMPLLPWDVWGMIEKKDDELNEEELALLDRAAIASMWEIDYPFLRTLYSENVHFRVPEIITTSQKDGCVKINIATEEIAP